MDLDAAKMDKTHREVSRFSWSWLARVKTPVLFFHVANVIPTHRPPLGPARGTVLYRAGPERVRARDGIYHDLIEKRLNFGSKNGCSWSKLDQKTIKCISLRNHHNQENRCESPHKSTQPTAVPAARRGSQSSARKDWIGQQRMVKWTMSDFGAKTQWFINFPVNMVMLGVTPCSLFMICTWQDAPLAGPELETWIKAPRKRHTRPLLRPHIPRSEIRFYRGNEIS